MSGVCEHYITTFVRDNLKIRRRAFLARAQLNYDIWYEEIYDGIEDSERPTFIVWTKIQDEELLRIYDRMKGAIKSHPITFVSQIG